LGGCVPTRTVISQPPRLRKTIRLRDQIGLKKNQFYPRRKCSEGTPSGANVVSTRGLKRKISLFQVPIVPFDPYAHEKSNPRKLWGRKGGDERVCGIPEKVFAGVPSRSKSLRTKELELYRKNVKEKPVSEVIRLTKEKRIFEKFTREPEHSYEKNWHGGKENDGVKRS